MVRYNKLVKIVYEDGKASKVIKGKIISEDEFTLVIDPIYNETNEPITLGKRAIVQIISLGDRR